MTAIIFFPFNEKAGQLLEYTLNSFTDKEQTFQEVNI